MLYIKTSTVIWLHFKIFPKKKNEKIQINKRFDLNRARKILNTSFFWMGIEPITVGFSAARLPCATMASIYLFILKKTATQTWTFHSDVYPCCQLENRIWTYPSNPKVAAQSRTEVSNGPKVIKCIFFINTFKSYFL